MKTLNIVIFLVLIANMIGCVNKNDANSYVNNDLTSFMSLSDTSYYELRDLTIKYGQTVYAKTSFSMVFPEQIGSYDINMLQDSIIYKMFASKNMTLDAAIKNYLESPLGVEESTIKEVLPSSVNEINANMLVTTGAVSLFTPELLVYRIDRFFYYYHAAHGMYISSFVNYYIPKQKIVTADDIFKSVGKDEILSVIRSEAVKKYSNNEMLNPNLILSYNTFYLTESTITFVYQPYEIGPYALGMVEISIYPYMIRNWLTSLCKEIFNIQL